MRSCARLFSSGLLLVAAGFLAVPFLGSAETAAQTAPAASSSSETAQQPASKFIQDLGDRALEVLANKSATEEQRSDKYHEILRHSFDLKTIGRFVIGRAWNSATPEQQQEYMKLFEELVVKTYGDRLSLYTGEKFQVKDLREEGPKVAVVTSEVIHPRGSKSTKIEWRVRQDGEKFAIIDVVIEGVSQSVTQRSEYSSIVQREGMNGLLSHMKQRLQGLSPSEPR